MCPYSEVFSHKFEKLPNESISERIILHNYKLLDDISIWLVLLQYQSFMSSR